MNDDLNPARYAAQLAETIGSLHRHLAAEQPDWWQQVVDELHSRLDKEFPPFYDSQECGAALYAAFATCEECGHKFNQGADVIPPWKGGDAPVEQPDYFQLPGMEHKRMDLMDWRFNGIEERLAAWERRAELLEQRIEGIEAKAHGAFNDDWDTDYCRVCGIHNQSTHAPWCEYRDGTPVAEIDRWRLFGDWVNERLTALETKSAL